MAGITKTRYFLPKPELARATSVRCHFLALVNGPPKKKPPDIVATWSCVGYDSESLASDLCWPCKLSGNKGGCRCSDHSNVNSPTRFEDHLLAQ